MALLAVPVEPVAGIGAEPPPEVTLGEVGGDAVELGGREPGQELGEQRLLGDVGRGRR